MLMPDMTSTDLSPLLVDAGALGRVHVAENVELVEAGEYDEKHVPGHQDPAVPFVQLPAVQVRRDDQEGHRGQQRKCRVCQPYKITQSTLFFGLFHLIFIFVILFVSKNAILAC